MLLTKRILFTGVLTSIYHTELGKYLKSVPLKTINWEAHKTPLHLLCYTCLFFKKQGNLKENVIMFAAVLFITGNRTAAIGQTIATTA